MRVAPKWTGIAGQDEALLFVATDVPAGLDISRVARVGADLGSNTGPLPLAWGAADPYGFQARLAGEITADFVPVLQPAILWQHGRQDATGGSTHYGVDLLALVARVDALAGRSDIIWGIVRLPASFTTGSAASVRAAQESVVATLGARAFLINADDPNISSLTIWDQFLTGMATATGDASWNVATPAYRVAIDGQSNAGAFQFSYTTWYRPPGATVHLDGPGSASIEEAVPGVGNHPYYWKSTDPNTARARLAAFLRPAQEGNTLVNVWIHGECATTENPNNHYGGDVLGLMQNIDARAGHSRTIWVIVLLNSAATLPSSPDPIRTQQQSTAASFGARALVVDPNSLGAPALDGVHYNNAQLALLWDMILAALMAYTGDASWAP